VVLDSGSSNHITNDLSKLRNVRQTDCKMTITFGNGGQLLAEAIGDAEFCTDVPNDDTKQKIILRDVLYVPTATANLLSVRCATRNGAAFRFSDDSCIIIHDGKVIATALWRDNVYCVRAFSTGVQGKAFTGTSQESSELWHRRFGHLGYDSLAKLVRDNMVDGINVPELDFKNAKDKVCEPCIMA